MVVAAERCYADSVRKIIADAGVQAGILNYGHPLLAAARGLDPGCLALLAPLATRRQVHTALCEVCSPPHRPTDQAARSEPSRIAAAKILLPLCDVDDVDMFGATPLMQAVVADLPGLAREVMGHCDVDRQSNRRLETALHRAAAMRSSRCLRDLIEASDAGVRDDEGATALMKFAGDDFDALRALVAKSDVFAWDHRGGSAIEKMLMRGHVEAARTLFDAVGHKERVELLRRLDASPRIKGAGVDGQKFADLRAGLFASMEAKLLAQGSEPAARGPGSMRV